MVELPKGVHRVISRQRTYYYFQLGRGTKGAEGSRIRLPDDPYSPEFWQAIREAQGAVEVVATNTVGALIDAYLLSPAFAKLRPGTQDQYQRGLRLARDAWQNLPALCLTPEAVTRIMDNLADSPGKANTFLGVMRALSQWSRARGRLPQSVTEGVKPYPKEGGHKPWTEAQIAAAHEKLEGMVRRGVMLMLYTGQRGSDVVRLGWTDIEDGGFRLRQQKTGKDVWCPILDELAAEMATWERRPGPFLLQVHGKPYDRKRLDVHFAKAREQILELAGTTLHGLRSTAVIRLRREGLTPTQIDDIIGMSLAMIQRYCRFADRKMSGQAAAQVISMNRTRTERGL